MENNNYAHSYEIGTSELMALCHILGEFEEFQKNIKEFLSSKYCDYNTFKHDLSDISHGRFKLGASKTKKFYSENKSVVDKINKYSHIILFLDYNFTTNGDTYDNLLFFYNYILNHSNEIDKILAVLNKLKKLGFENLDFNSNWDFTKEIHKIDTVFICDSDIVYLDNLVAVPDYNPGTLSYKTTNSQYKIYIGKVGFAHKNIFLNSLTFNSDVLPSSLSIKEILYKVLELKEEKKKEYTSIEDSVKLGVSIDDLYDMYNTVSSTIDKLESVEKKAELAELLLTIKEAILKMQTISTEYNQKVADENPSISEEFLEEQKKAYIRRREDSKIHVW